MAWAAAGGALVFIGFIGLMPVLRRRARHVSFAGPHGDVFYDLDSVENTIERVVGRMNEIKSIDAHVAPADDNRRVEVSADVVLNPTGGSARDAATLVSQQIERAAEQMLGEDGVTKVVLRVKKILVDMKAPLLVTPSAPGHEARQEFQGIEEAEREAEEERRAALAKAEESRRAALAEAARVNAAAEARVVAPEPAVHEQTIPVELVLPAKREEEQYSYLPEDEDEEERKEEDEAAPLEYKNDLLDENPTPTQFKTEFIDETPAPSDTRNEFADDDDSGLPPLEELQEEDKDKDQPRSL
jgi:hypothetical protein